MAMRFLFKPLESIDRSSLCQGDVIHRSPPLADAISEAHEYYGRAQDYTHFVVLTQSCDLVRRDGRINAPYLTLAAARPIRIVISKFIESSINEIDNSGIRVIKSTTRRRLEQLLERLIHNTEDGLFYLPEDGCEAISEDLCVFLHLSIALRTDHYPILLQNKIAEIDDIFRAKLGWLKGNIYSRVATPDVEEYVDNPKAYKREFYKKHTPEEEYLWLSNFQLTLLKKQIREFVGANKVGVIDEDNAQTIIDKLPTDADIVVKSIVDRMVNRQIIANDPEVIKKTQNVIKNTPHFKEVLGYIQR